MSLNMSRTSSDKWQRAKRFGVDVSLLEDNIRKSIMERVLEHQNALDLVFALEVAGREYYAKFRKTHPRSRRRRR